MGAHHCTEHSGITARLDNIERFIEKIDDRFFKILSCVAISLMATVLTAVMTMYYNTNSRVDKLRVDGPGGGGGEVVVERTITEGI